MNKVDLIQMIKLFLVFLLCFLTINAKDLQPSYIYTASGGVTDVVTAFDKIYVATAASSVDIFDLKTKKIINSIKIPQIKDFMGDMVDAKIYSVDIFNNKVLLVNQASKGLREIYLFENNKLINLISIDKKLLIGKSKFIMILKYYLVHWEMRCIFMILNPKK
jgi:WD40 repeat protein